MRPRLLMPLLALLLAAAESPLPAELSDPETTEGWIWQRVQAGAVADLNDRCKTPTLSVQSEDPLWREPCRSVRSDLLRALLTRPDLEDHAPHGVRLRGAWIDGDLDLRDVHVRAAEVWLDGSRIAGDVSLNNAKLDGLLSLEGTSLEGHFDGEHLVVSSDLFLSNAKFGGPVDMRDAHVEGLLTMSDASVAKDQMFNAERLKVGSGGFFLRNANFGGPVDLRSVHVEGPVDMESASVAENQMFIAERLKVGSGGFFLRNAKFGGPVLLRDAHVDGQMTMVSASVAKNQTFDAERLHVGSGGLFLRNATFGGPVVLLGLAVDGVLDLRNSRVRQLDLSGAVIRDDLVLGGLLGGSESLLRWDDTVAGGPSMNLRNARVGNLQDDESAWPPRITLEGFTYAHLGGFGGEQRQDMRNRDIDWWRGWLNRDPVYSAQPYAQLAGVLAAAGNRDGAAAIRFFSRDRERTELLRGCTWLQKLGWVEKPDDARPCGLNRWGAWVGLTALQCFVGYGIGGYGFRAVGGR